jgi:hypothetical protein
MYKLGNLGKPSIGVEKIFWQGDGINESVTRVVRIDVHRDSYGVCGISFHYESGIIRHVGLQVEDPSSLEIKEDEKIGVVATKEGSLVSDGLQYLGVSDLVCKPDRNS